jgi:hypothetical protein
MEWIERLLFFKYLAGVVCTVCTRNRSPSRSYLFFLNTLYPELHRPPRFQGRDASPNVVKVVSPALRRKKLRAHLSG